MQQYRRLDSDNIKIKSDFEAIEYRAVINNRASDNIEFPLEKCNIIKVIR
jgi:hypothetical protein